MADDNQKLAVLIEANTKAYENAMKKVMATTNAAMAKAGTSTKRLDRQLSMLDKTSARVASGFGRLAAGLAAGLSVGAVVRFSDAYTRVQNSLKMAGLEGERLDTVYNRLMATAQANAAPIEALAELYGKVSLAQRELGITSDQLTDFTDTIAVALRASGKSAAESSGALQQLSQALGGGVVRAEEFNSILEGAPTIAMAAAAGIKEAGGSVSTLRNLMIDGQISSKAFFDGIQAGAPVLQDLAAKTELTVAQSFTLLNNALVDSVGKFGDATGASNLLAESIQGVAKAIEGIDWNGLLSGYQNYADQAYKIGQQVRNAIVETFGGTGDYSNLNPNGIGLAPRASPGAPNTGVPEGFTFGANNRGASAVKPISLADYKVPGKGTGASTSASKALADETKRVEALSGAYSTASEILDGFAEKQKIAADRQRELANELSSFADGIVSDLRNGASAADALNNALNRVLDSFISTGIDGLSQALAGAFMRQPGTALPGITGHAMGPRALGGPVSKGKPYLVGERGRELFVPETGGRIVPGGGGGSTVVNIMNNSGAQVQERRRQSGNREIVDVVIGEVNKAVASGKMDKSMGSRFGATPKRMQG